MVGRAGAGFLLRASGWPASPRRRTTSGPQARSCVTSPAGAHTRRHPAHDDPSFLAFLKYPAFLTKMLPISKDVDAILRRVFALNPDKRMGLAELRDAVAQVERFTMTEDELATATEATREAARAFAGGNHAEETKTQVKAQPIEVVISGTWDSDAEVSDDDFSLESPPVSPWTFDAKAFVAPTAATPAPAAPSTRKPPPSPLINLGPHAADFTSPGSTPPQSPGDSDSASDATASQPVTPTNATHPVIIIADPKGSDAELTHASNHVAACKNRPASYLTDYPLFASWAEQSFCY